MITKHGLVVALVLGLVAVLYQVEVTTSRWMATERAVVHADQRKLWAFIANTDTVDKWFHWVSRFRAIDARPMGKGKRFEVLYNIPVVGEYAMKLQVAEYTPGSLIVLESDELLQPRFSLAMEDQGEGNTRITFTLEFQRNSALFRCTLGPVMWLLSSQQLRHSLFLIKTMFPA